MTTITWTLEERDPKELQLNEKNPRKITKKQAEDLKKSLEKYGTCQPIVINTDNTIIGGHQRYRVLCQLGVMRLSVYVPSRRLEQAEADELGIRLNRNGGDWDFDALSNNFNLHDLLDWGFSRQELLDEEPAAKEPTNFKIEISCMDEGDLAYTEQTIKKALPFANIKTKVK